jgi:hypothetical protein
MDLKQETNHVLVLYGPVILSPERQFLIWWKYKKISLLPGAEFANGKIREIFPVPLTGLI